MVYSITTLVERVASFFAAAWLILGQTAHNDLPKSNTAFGCQVPLEFFRSKHKVNLQRKAFEATNAGFEQTHIIKVKVIVQPRLSEKNAS